MAKRRCRDCPTLIAADSYKGRCTPCNRATDKARGTRQQRGYGTGHQATRQWWQHRLDGGEQIACANPHCLTPDVPIDPDAWHLGHDPQRRHRGPEHPLCNLHEAGLAAHGR